MKKIKNICKKFLIICGIFIYSFTSISVQTQASAVLITGVTFTLGEFVATLLGFSVVSGLSYQKINGCVALDKKALTPREVVVDPAGLTKLRMCKSVADLIRMGFTSKTARYYNEACIEYKSAVVQEIVACNNRIKEMTRDVVDEAIKQKIIAQEKAKFDDTLLEQTISKTRGEFKEAMIETVKKLDMRIDNNYAEKTFFDVGAANIGNYNTRQFCGATHFLFDEYNTKQNTTLFNLFMTNVKQLGYKHIYFISTSGNDLASYTSPWSYFNNYKFPSRNSYKILRTSNNSYNNVIADVQFCVATNGTLSTTIRSDAYTFNDDYGDIRDAKYINVTCTDDYAILIPQIHRADWEWLWGERVASLDKSVELCYPLGHEKTATLEENVFVLDTTYVLEDVKEVAISATLPIRIPYDEVDVISDVVVGEHAIEATRDYVLDRDLFIENVWELDNTIVNDGTLEDDKVLGGDISINLPKIFAIDLCKVSGMELDKEKANGFDFSSVTKLGEKFTTRFPFSLPWDIVNLLKKFDRPQMAPKFTFSLDSFVPREFRQSVKGINFNLDFTDYEKIIIIVRYFLLLEFVSGLIKCTTSLIKH